MTAKVRTRNREAGVRIEAALLRVSQEKQGDIEPEDASGNLVVQLRPATEDLKWGWYEGITGRISVGSYIVALCYATAVILVGWWPWNILLILPVLLLRTHNALRFGVFVRPKESVRKVLCGRGGSL